MKNALFIVGILAAMLIVISPMVKALYISSIDAPVLQPGKSGELVVEVANDADDDIKDVSFSMDLTGLPLSTDGTSEDSIDKIKNDDEDSFSFTLRAANNAKPGDYNIPYLITYTGSTVPKKGTIGVKISAPIRLSFTSTIDTPVVGQRAKVTLKIINSGEADARFVDVSIVPEGYTLLSEERLYIGTVSSDDFETATFDVLLNSPTPSLTGTVEYTDFESIERTAMVDIPLSVYSREKAIELGIIKKNNTLRYIGIVVVIIIIWLIVRSIRKRIRKKKSLQGMQNSNGR